MSFDKLNISNIKSEPKTIKQEPVECSSLTALRAVTPASPYSNKLRYGLDHHLDTIFQKEDSMSISLDGECYFIFLIYRREIQILISTKAPPF